MLENIDWNRSYPDETPGFDQSREETIDYSIPVPLRPDDIIISEGYLEIDEVQFTYESGQYTSSISLLEVIGAEGPIGSYNNVALNDPRTYSFRIQTLFMPELTIHIRF